MLTVFVKKLKKEEQFNGYQNENAALKEKIDALEKLLADKSTECIALQNYITNLHQGTDKMLGETNDLTVSFPGDDEISAALNSTFKNLNDRLVQIIHNMARIAEASRIMENTTNTLKVHNKEQVELIQNISQANQEFVSQTKVVSGMGKKLDEMANSTAVVAEEGQRMLVSNKAVFETLDSQIAENGNFMDDLSETIRSVGELTTFITDVAERLKLLALNAAIESARAGEAGKGFAVVAQYISELAGDADTSAKKVKDIMNTMSERNQVMKEAILKSQDLVKQGNHQLSEGISKFRWIYEELKNFKENTAAIAESLDKQFDGVSLISDLSARSLDFSKDLLGLAEEVSGSSESLDEVVKVVLEELGVFRLELHTEGLKSLEETMRTLPEEADWGKIESAVKGQLNTGSCFELLYVMDKDGIQRTNNMVNPLYRDSISAVGQGQNRREKDYFREVTSTGRPFVSSIYLSSATGNLCITVSAPLLKKSGEFYGVLAGDINLQ